MNQTILTDAIDRCRRRALEIRCGGRSEKYQRDGETGWFYADDINALLSEIERLYKALK